MLFQKLMIAGMVSLLFLSACSTEKSNPSSSVDHNDEVAESQQQEETGKQDSVETTTQDDQDPAEGTKEAADAAELVNFVKKQYTKGEIKVDYPQIANPDFVQAENINEVIVRGATYFFENGLYEGYTGEIKFETTFQDEEVASFLYQGLLTSTNQMYPINLSYSTIVNLQTGEKVTLSDLVTVDEAFVDKFKQGKILSDESEEYSNEVKNYISSLGNEQLLNELSKADNMDSSSAFTYVTDDSIVVILGVPHALGDFVQVEIAR
ncbi:hypothetical protein [Mesobacillus jeotgali]|uniref:DUF4163 domain-containing protein n=1 Tax=Mesobacillus jeotgali TaxID=129985 RepID=A0ABY9VNU3_9BACI|nr:hypothetical protein [Mesobacillus jeotgali]WNF23402.1 hypothetical protein RH061_02515 [Mesobacillus jeotgali]